MGVDLLICFDCYDPTLLDTAGTAASIYATILLAFAAAGANPRWRPSIEGLQLLAYSSGIPVFVAVLLGVLAEFPDYAAVAISAAVAALPLGILAAGTSDAHDSPVGALDLAPGPRFQRLPGPIVPPRAV